MVRNPLSTRGLTLRQVIVRARISFVLMVVALAAIVQWNTAWRNDLHAKNAAQAHRNHLLEIRLQKVADGLVRDQQIADYNLRLAKFDACMRANDVIARIIFVVAAQPGVTATQVATVRKQFGLERCPPKPTLPPVQPRAVVPTTTSTTTRARPSFTAVTTGVTIPVRGHGHKKKERP